jgi:hypothetical protein
LRPCVVDFLLGERLSENLGSFISDRLMCVVVTCAEWCGVVYLMDVGALLGTFACHTYQALRHCNQTQARETSDLRPEGSPAASAPSRSRSRFYSRFLLF